MDRQSHHPAMHPCRLSFDVGGGRGSASPVDDLGGEVLEPGVGRQHDRGPDREDVAGRSAQAATAACQAGSKVCMAPTRIAVPVVDATAVTSAASSADIANGFSHKTARLPARQAAITWAACRWCGLQTATTSTASSASSSCREVVERLPTRAATEAATSRGDVEDLPNLELVGEPGEGRQMDRLGHRAGADETHTQRAVRHHCLLCALSHILNDCSLSCE